MTGNPDRCPKCGGDRLINDGVLMDVDGVVRVELGTCADCGARLRYEHGELRVWSWQEWQKEQIALLRQAARRVR